MKHYEQVDFVIWLLDLSRISGALHIIYKPAAYLMFGEDYCSYCKIVAT
jgi:hypothetical protein